MTKHINIVLDNNTHHRFKIKCVTAGIPMVKAIRNWIEKYLNGELKA